MGSFNVTCQITNTPIIPNQTARVFFLVGRGHKYGGAAFNQSCCYPWDNFQIIGLPLKGIYKDYNNFSFENKKMEQYVVDCIKGVYQPNRVAEGKTLADYNEYHDYMNVEVEELNMQKILNMRHSGSLNIKHFQGKGFINTMVVHEDIYQYMISKKISIWKENKPKEFNHEELTQDILEEISNTKLTEFQQKIIDDMLSEESLKEIGTTKVDKEGNSYIYTKEHLEKCIKYLRQMFIRQNKMRDIRYDYLYNFKGIDDSLAEYEVKDLAEAFAGVQIFMQEMFVMNKSLYPEMTSGQEYDFNEDSERFKVFADIISNLRSDEDEGFLPVKQQTLYSLQYSDVLDMWEDYDESYRNEQINIFKNTIKNIDDQYFFNTKDLSEDDKYFAYSIPTNIRDKEIEIIDYNG